MAITQNQIPDDLTASMARKSEFENGVILHHIGYVVASIDQAIGSFAESLRMEPQGPTVYDPLQTVYVAFLRSRVIPGTTIELVQPEGVTSAVYKFLQRGGGLHHMCYEVDHLEKQLQWARDNRDLVVRGATPAAAFAGRPIAWIYTKSRLLVEYLERCR